MAYVHVGEWSPDQIADWLKGLDGSIAQYIPLFLHNGVKGQQLLSLRSDDLENLGVFPIGHQELILEAVGQLRHFHYELDRENLQYLALKLSCVATSLYNELLHHQDSSKVETQTLGDVTNVISMVKPLACWLDRSPFSGQADYTEKKTALLRLSLEMATSAQRDRFAERPLLAIRDSCQKLAILADIIIQEISDPMVLQPATLDLATLKKREHEIGFDILPSCNGIHQVTDIKFVSPAHSSGKIEDGDEIVQVNYQTVVGWQPKEVLLLCQDSPADILLTLKKRPRHTHTYGQIYMKPYRLPSRKRATPYNRWGNLPSPRPELLAIPDFEMPLPRPSPVPVVLPEMDLGENSSSNESETSQPGSPTSEHMSSQHRIYLPKPRSVVQRRNTTSGSSPVSKRPTISIEQFWRELKNHKSLKHTGSAQMASSNDSDDISDNLYRRDKSVSCSTGLELSPRPKTCLGVGLNHSKVVKLKEKLIINSDEKTSTKTVKFHEHLVTVNKDIYKGNRHEESILKETKERGRLDKSHSTPAYDFGEVEENEYPLLAESIPESPTSPVDSPNTDVTSYKVDQILEFKKCSTQIGGAMISQKNKDKSKADAGNSLDPVVKVRNTSDEYISITQEVPPIPDKGSQIIETINIALLEHRKKESTMKAKNIDSSSENIFVTEFGESTSKKIYDSGMNEQILMIQNELLEAINEQRKLIAQKPQDLKSLSKPDVPPEPPPRPLSTQKPGYIPPKSFKNIQKRDIQVIPNTEIIPPIIPLRKDISLPVNVTGPVVHGSNFQCSPKDVEPKQSSNTNSSEISHPRTPTMSAKTLQILEEDKSPNKTDTSTINMKSNFESPKLSISPANSMVRGILSTGKSKSLKKKNSILAKRRKISVKDLGMGDMHGPLHQRCRTKNSSRVNWEPRWYVLLGNTFYGFKNKESLKADCLIFLSGFTVSVAQEVKSKEFAFKIYHTGTVFYFSCETLESLQAWVECITRATLTNNDSWERASKKDKKTEESRHFSETDYSDEEFSLEKSQSDNKSKHKDSKQEKSEKSNKFGSLKKFARMHKSDSQENVNHSSTSLDRKYLRFFYKPSKNKEEKSKFKSNDIPVPTDQYRSYRKIPFSGPSLTNVSQAGMQQASSVSKITQAIQDEAADGTQNIAKIIKIEPFDSESASFDDDNLSDLTNKYSKKVPNPINYIHASNPNLLDFEKSDFLAKPKCNAPFTKNIVQRPDNFIGFVTLEQFMLNKQEEERRQVYSNRVLMGVERDARSDEKNQNKKLDRSFRDNNNLQRQLDKIVPDVIYGEIPTFMKKNMTPAKMEQIQNRCLPKTPDIANVKTARKLSDAFINSNAETLVLPSEHRTDQSRGDKKHSFLAKKKNDGYETIKYDEDDSVIPFSSPVSQKALSSKQLFNNIKTKDGTEKTIHGDIKQSTTINISCESSVDLLQSSKTFENIESNSSDTVSLPKGNSISSNNRSKDIENESNVNIPELAQEIPITSNNFEVEAQKVTLRKLSNESKKSIPSSKTSSKKPCVSRQNSITSLGDRKSTNIDKPVFKQGDSPEKFWLDSLRRNDKVYLAKYAESSSGGIKADKFYTKHTEPSAYMKSSEATIVKSDKLQNKTLFSESSLASKACDHKPLKSANQYTPMSLSLVSPNKALKTSPQFELSLDSRDPPSAASGMSRLRQMFQHGSSSSSKSSFISNVTPSKEKTLLGSPRLHRAIFRKQHNAPDEWTQDFVYSKGPVSSSHSDCVISNDSYLFSVSQSGSAVTMSSDTSSPSNMTTPDYPHLEYPPVFEAETYSLADPGPSILRKKNNYDTERK